MAVSKERGGRSDEHLRVPLVSVIVRSIGRPDLGRALASVAAQRYPAIEVICVNARGPGHPAVDQRVGNVPVRTVETGRALGRSEAANAGLRAAAGEYVAFLDDDDWFLEEHVENLVRALQDGAGSRLAYANVEGVTADGAVAHRFGEPFSYARLCAGNFIPTNAALFGRSVVDEGCSFDESLDAYEDWDFWLQLAERGTFVHVDRVSARCSMAGSSGVGLAPDCDRQRAARIRIYEKWRHRWTGEQIEALVERLREEAQARDRLVLAAVAAAEQAEESAHAARSDAGQARAELLAVLRSRSWRWTAPLRSIGARLAGRKGRGVGEG